MGAQLNCAFAVRICKKQESYDAESYEDCSRKSRQTLDYGLMGTAAHLITPGPFDEINITSYLNYHDTQLYPLALFTIECDSICLHIIN